MTELPKNAEPQLRVGHWSFRTVPTGWEPLENHGLRQAGRDAFPSNAIATEDELQGQMTLEEYLQSQFPIVRHYFADPQFEVRGAVKINGVEEAMMLMIRFKADDGRPAIQRQIYVRNGRRVGVLTFTTLETELSTVDSCFEAILSGASFPSSYPR